MRTPKLKSKFVLLAIVATFSFQSVVSQAEDRAVEESIIASAGICGMNALYVGGVLPIGGILLSLPIAAFKKGRRGLDKLTSKIRDKVAKRVYVGAVAASCAVGIGEGIYVMNAPEDDASNSATLEKVARPVPSSSTETPATGAASSGASPN